MSKFLRARHIYAVMLALLGLEWTFAARSARATCYDTPRNAVDALGKTSITPQASKNRGYQVIMTQSDTVLGKRWAKVASCDHPDRPNLALPVSEGDEPLKELRSGYFLTQRNPETVVVHAGEVVRLWRQEPFARIETTGVSEESGGIGKAIHLRLLFGNSENRSTYGGVVGIVRGPSDVEMQP